MTHGSLVFLSALLVLISSINFTSCSKCIPITTEQSSLDQLTLTITGTEVQLEITQDQNVLQTGILGKSLLPELGQPTACTEGSLCWQWGDAAQLSISKSADNVCYDVAWRVKNIVKQTDCFDIGSAFWYFGGEEHDQYFPLKTSSPRSTIPMLPGDMLQDKDAYLGGVAEPWWINSNGIGIWVPEGIPLFFSWNENQDNQLCLTSMYERPYVRSDPDFLNLRYKICSEENAKEVQIYGTQNLLGLPTGIPDTRMISMPIWSTWAQYKADINDSVVLEFANAIRARGFNDSQIEIDDNWENCYGEAQFDPVKFPDPQGLVNLLKSLGFRVTLWVHPFVNLECPSWQEVALGLTKGYFVQDPKQIRLNERLPGLVYWWDGDLAGYVDFTNEAAVNWWRARLDAIRSDFGVDSFKFDAGEANWLPTSIRLLNGLNPELWPEIFSSKYAESVSYFGNQIEVRIGRRSQSLPIFVRMLDKYSRWGYDNGLKTMVTTLLQMSIAGYPFVLPDMIGGNGYAGQPSRELYIRWLQANVFMPSMQFSYVPWMYDQEVVSHALQMTALHYDYSDEIIALATQAQTSGEPINRPIWWLDPNDSTALSIDSEFLLGNDLLVAPVLDEGALTRDIYLPVGSWRDEADSNHPTYTGPLWLRDYPADLFTLPYFTRV